eukprot:4343101-Amphidinium_carterae.3
MHNTPGTLCHRRGERAFPLARAPVVAANITDQWEVAVRVDRKEVHEKELQLANEHKVNMQQLCNYAKELPDLCNRYSLKQVGPWHRVPHTCPCYCLAYPASHAVEAITSANDGEFPAQTLAQEWRRLHVGLEASSASDKKAVPRRFCMESNFCTCRGDGRVVGRFWAKAKQALTSLFADKALEKLLRRGCVCIQWTSTLLDSGGCTRTPSSPKYTTIPAHSFKPWRPTLLEFDFVEAYSNDSGKFVRLKLRSTPEGIPCFFGPHLYTSTLDLTSAWALQLLVFSELNKAFPNSAGEIMVKAWTPEPQCFWNGKTAEMTRVRGKKTDRHDIVEEITEEDALDLWADSDCELTGGVGVGDGPEAGVDEKENFGGWIPDIDSDGLDVFEAGELETVCEWLEASEAMRLADGLAADQPDNVACEEEVGHEQESEAAELRNENAEHSSSSSSTSSSSSSTSSSASTKSKFASCAALSQGVEAEAMTADAADEGRQRVTRPESHHWGRFYFTWKPPRAWQATCYFHNRHTNPRCRKTSSIVGDVTEESSAKTLRLLKLWCLQCVLHDTKEGHTSGRGLPHFAEEDLSQTDAALDEAEAALPDLPE